MSYPSGLSFCTLILYFDFRLQYLRMLDTYFLLNILTKHFPKCTSQNNFHSFEGIELLDRMYFDLVIGKNGPYFPVIDRTSKISGYVEQFRPA